MKNRTGKLLKGNRIRLTLAAAVFAIAVGVLANPFGTQQAAPSLGDVTSKMYKRPAPDFDLNETRNIPNARAATGEQLAALTELQTTSGAANITSRWNDFGGSPDVVYDFASQAFSGTPEEAGRAFLSQNASLFGVSDVNNLRVFSERAAGGGHLIRFQQTFNGIPVQHGGVGLVMNANKQVIMASGPHFRNVSVNTNPTLSADQARAKANEDLARFSVNLPAAINNLLQPAFDHLGQQTAIVNNIPPTLAIYPTADSFRLVWKVAKYSTNPFGVYVVSIDAHTGETVARKDMISMQTTPGNETADIFPKYPQIDDNLKNNSVISTCNGPLGPAPCGQERVTLRKFNASNRVTGVQGLLTGQHAIVTNALATQQPFGQAPLGTWHFRVDNPTALEARTNEQDQLAEPAEHQDEINAFFFLTYLMEYVDNLHIGSDNNQFGGGAFPDDYPGKTVPMPGSVHIPNIYIALEASAGQLPDPSHPDFVKIVMGLDNAISINLTSLIEEVTATKSPAVVNPTVYGHGYMFNDLALEGTVPYHEGMHSTTSPIAGLEGSEGSALNEGQADMWAFTITDNPSLGDYVVNAKGFRQYYRDRGGDADLLAYIRSAKSTLKYSDIGTWSAAAEFEEHYDGEIYMSTMWDIREMLNRLYPQTNGFRRPTAKNGLPEKVITKGTHVFERDFLMSMYILGTTAPDTIVKARDAMIIADQMLYPSDSADASAPGKHRSMIEQIYAAKELGINAREVTGGVATVSTQVSHFTGGQAAPAVPQNVIAAPASTKSIRVTWDAVPGALAYEVLKRKSDLANQREPNGKRAYNDGDASTTGYRHVAFVNGTSHEDKGVIREVFNPLGLANLFDSEYVVRAIGANSNGQVGWSDVSGSSATQQARQDLTSQVDSAISNISFANGVMSFDNKLTNARGAFSTDKTIYKPLEFQIVSISNPSVTVKNPDANGNTFVYNQTLTLGQTSAAKRLEFNDPLAQMFSFDARIYGHAFAGSSVGNGSGGNDGSSDPPPAVTYSIFRETKSGALIGGEPADPSVAPAVTWGDPLFKGITWEDVPVTTKADALALEGRLSATGATVDLDFELRTTDGQILMRSATASANEFVSSNVQPNTTYIFRVLGWANGPTTFSIQSDQLLPQGSPNENAGTRSTGGTWFESATTPSISGLFRFTVNPLTRRVTFIRLQ